MAEWNEGKKAFTAGEDLARYRRVKQHTTAEQVVYADAGEDYLGITANGVSSGELVTVIARNFPGTKKVTALTAFSLGDKLWGAADGMVDDVEDGPVQFIALEAATALNDIVEAMPTDAVVGALHLDGKVRIGTNDWGVGATGVLLDGTDPDMANATFARINSASLAAGAYSAGYNQLAITAALTNNVSVFSSWNELYFTGTTQMPANAAAVWGHVEISGTFQGPLSTSTYLGAFVGSIQSDAATVTNDGIMGAFVADSVLTSGFTNNAVIAAFVAHVNASHATRANWPFGLYCDGVDTVLGFGSGTNYEDGVKVNAGAVTPGANGSVAVRIQVGSTLYYMVGYAAGEVSGE